MAVAADDVPGGAQLADLAPIHEGWITNQAGGNEEVPRPAARREQWRNPRRRRPTPVVEGQEEGPVGSRSISSPRRRSAGLPDGVEMARERLRAKTVVIRAHAGETGALPCRRNVVI